MAEFLGDRSIGRLLLVLALPMALPVPASGISVLFGVPLIVISAQLALGYHRAWLPARLARRSVPRSTFSTLALGLIERDGIAIALGIVTTIFGLLVVTFASAGILNAARLWPG
jgi:hypothetical protein